MAAQESNEDTAREKGAKDFASRQSEMFSADFSFSGYERDLVALNLGGKRFINISGVSGADSVTDGRGAAFADFDNDGDMDIFLRTMHGPAQQLFRNNVGQDRGFMRISLQGKQSGLDAFGAVVRVKTSAGILTQTKSGGGGFLSQSDPRLLFGLGDDEQAEWIEVSWPSGNKQRYAGVKSGASLLLTEGKEKARSIVEKRFNLPDPLTPLQERFTSLRVKPGQQLPGVTVLGSSTGKKTALIDLLEPGQPALLNFWATWCVSCKVEMPALQELHVGDGSKGLRIIGVNVDVPAARKEIPSVLEKLGVTYPIVCIDQPELGKLLSSPDVGIPLSILLDEKHRVVDVFEGWSPQLRERLTKIAKSSVTQTETRP